MSFSEAEYREALNFSESEAGSWRLSLELRHLEEQLAGVAELLASVRKEQVDTRTAREAQKQKLHQCP